MFGFSKAGLLDKILVILFFLFGFALVFSISLTDIIKTITVIFILFKIVVERDRVQFSRAMVILLLLMVFALVITTFLSENRIKSLDYWPRVMGHIAMLFIGIYFANFYLTRAGNLHIKTFLSSLLIFTIVQSVFIFLSWNSVKLPFDILNLGTSIEKHPIGTFTESLNLGVVFLFSSFIVPIFFLSSKKLREIHKIIRIAIILVLLVIFVGVIVISGTFEAYISIIIAYLFVISAYIHVKYKWKVSIPIFIILSVSAYILISNTGEWFIIKDNIDVYKYTLGKILEKPLTGHGFNTFNFVDYFHAHMNYLQVAYTNGVITAFLEIVIDIVCLIFLLRLILSREYSYEVKYSTIPILGIYIAFLVYGTMDFTYFGGLSGTFIFMVVGFIGSYYSIEKWRIQKKYGKERQVKFRRLLTAIFLVTIDYTSYYFALAIAYFIRVSIEKIFPAIPKMTFDFSYLISLWWVPLVFFTFFLYHKLYTKRIPFWDEAKELFKALGIATLAVFSVAMIANIGGDAISRLTFLLLLPISIILYPIARYFGKIVLFKFGIMEKNILIIGAGDSGKKILKGLVREQHMGYNVLGFLDDDENKIGKDIYFDDKPYKILGKTDEVERYKKGLNVDSVIVAMPSVDSDSISILANKLHHIFSKVYIVPELKNVAMSNTELQHLFLERLFLLRINNNLKSKINIFIKRVIDLISSIFIMIILSPIFILLAIYIRLDSKGPVFFSQDRIGTNMKPFKAVKFRSMHVNPDSMLEAYFKENKQAKEEWERFKKIKGDDPRVTEAGKLIRKYSLDELPQLFNVIAGSMSLVGPRPYLFREEKDMDEYKDTIVIAKPGITGLWQVSGRNKLDFNDRLYLDAWYVINWSLWLDIVILFKTVKVVLFREGAY